MEALVSYAAQYYQDADITNPVYEQALVQERWNTCYRWALAAWQRGFVVDPWIVNDNYPAFGLWIVGIFTDERLMVFTGVKRHDGTSIIKEG